MDDFFLEIFHTPIPDEGRMKSRLMSKLVLLTQATSYKDVAELTKAFESFKIIDKKEKETDEPLFLLRYVEDKPHLIIRFPDVRQQNENVKAHLGSYCEFFCSLLCVPRDNLMIDLDDHLGQDLKMPAEVNSSMKQCLTAAQTLTGSVGGKDLKFLGLHTNVPGLIFVLKTYNKISGVFRKSTKQAVTHNVLVNALNTAFGLNSRNANPFIVRLFKEFFRLLTSIHSRSLPASFAKYVKDRNKIKSREAIMIKLGYCTIIPPVSKVIEISTARFTVVASDKKKSVISFTEKQKDQEPLTHDKHFSAGVKMVLPLLHDCGSSKAADTVRAKAQLRIKDSEMTSGTRDIYLAKIQLVDSVSKTYAILSAGKDPKKKSTTADTAMNVVGKHSRYLIDKPYIDGNKIVYTTYMDIPLSYRRACEAIFDRKKSLSKKRKRDVIDEPDLSEKKTTKKKVAFNTLTPLHNRDKQELEGEDKVETAEGSSTDIVEE
jgi:hypothetical protein